MRYLLRLIHNNRVHVLLSRVIGAGVVLLLQLYIYKVETKEVSGIFFICYTVFQIMNVLCKFGADIFIVKNYNQLSYRMKRFETSASFYNSLLFSIPCAVMFFLICYGFALTWFGVNNITLSTYSILSIGFLLPLTSSSSIIYYIYQSKNKVVMQTLGLNVFQPSIFLLLYLVFSTLAMHVEVVSGVLPLVLSFYLSTFICFYVSLFASKKISYPIVLSKRMLNFRFHLNRVNRNKSFILSTAGTQVIGWLPYLLSSFILGPSFAGIFNLVQRFAMVNSFISASINSVSSPIMAKMRKDSNWQGIIYALKENTLYLSLASCVYGVGCITFLYLFGYLENKWQMLAAMIVITGYTINCSTSVCGYYFQIIASVVTMNKVIYSIIFFIPVISVMLSHLLGVIGASISIFLAVTSVNIILFPMMLLHVKKSLNKE